MNNLFVFLLWNILFMRFGMFIEFNDCVRFNSFDPHWKSIAYHFRIKDELSENHVCRWKNLEKFLIETYFTLNPHDFFHYIKCNRIFSTDVRSTKRIWNMSKTCVFICGFIWKQEGKKMHKRNKNISGVSKKIEPKG